MYHSSLTEAQKLSSTSTRRCYVEEAAKNATYYRFPKSTGYDDWVWWEEGKTEPAVQVCEELHEDGVTQMQVICDGLWELQHCLWMLCASSSSLVTSRSMPGWLLSTLQRWLLFRSQIQTYIKNSWVDPILCHRGGSCSWVHQPHHDSHWGLVGISQSASVLLGTQMRSVSGRECTRSNWRRWKVQRSQWLTR